MLLGYFTEEAYERLLSDSENNAENYAKDDEWLPQYFGRGVTYFGLSSKEVGEFTPYCSGDGKESENDLINARNIYDAFKITPLQASNKYMWAYLCHCVPKFRKYIQVRWKDSPAKYRYFVPNGQDGLYYFNALSRLWWCAHLTYDENSKDHYELTKILFDNQMVGKDFLGTFNGKNYNRMKGVLLALKDFKETVNPGEGIQKYFRECNKYLNHQAAINMFDFLEYEDIRKITFEKLVEVRNSIRKSGELPSEPVNREHSNVDVENTLESEDKSVAAFVSISNPNMTLTDFFNSRGLKTIDHRPLGCLWVLGEKKQISGIVEEAERLFDIKGSYGVSKSAGNRAGWWTKDKK